MFSISESSRAIVTSSPLISCSATASGSSDLDRPEPEALPDFLFDFFFVLLFLDSSSFFISWLVRFIPAMSSSSSRKSARSSVTCSDLLSSSTKMLLTFLNSSKFSVLTWAGSFSSRLPILSSILSNSLSSWPTKTMREPSQHSNSKGRFLSSCSFLAFTELMMLYCWVSPEGASPASLPLLASLVSESSRFVVPLLAASLGETISINFFVYGESGSNTMALFAEMIPLIPPIEMRIALSLTLRHGEGSDKAGSILLKSRGCKS
mmetsp:Transcript_9787/g.27887  ORF Transcript_9787/g.27887 Transcript_9787/m.27887 type:complete len:264 (-) Transcript_9787:721-1512(-)